MQLLFRTRNRQAQGLRDWVLIRTQTVLRRLSWRVAHASVQMTDVDGPRHGVDKQCRVSIVATDGTPVVVTATARDWRSALDHALPRAVEALKRLFVRTRQARRAGERHMRDERRLSLARRSA